MKIKKALSIVICISMIICATISTYALNNSNLSETKVDNKESFEFFDKENNHTEVLVEENEVYLYINGKLDNSAKVDAERGIIEYKEYNDDISKVSGVELDSRSVKKTKEYKISDFVGEASVEQEKGLSTKNFVEKPSLKDNIKSDISTRSYPPYIPGWTYRLSYTHSYHPYSGHGYYRDGGWEYVSYQPFTWEKGIALTVALAIIATIFTGGSIWIGLASAVVTHWGYSIVEGLFTRDVDGYVHLRIKWEDWLALIENRTTYQASQGTYYILITEPQTQIQVLEKAEGMGYAGYIFDFYDFMSDAVWYHVGIVGP